MTIFLIISILILGITLFIIITGSKKTKLKLTAEIQSKGAELNNQTDIIEKLTINLERFSGIISIESEIEKNDATLSVLKIQTQQLNEKFVNARLIFKELQKDIRLYENDLEFVELGIYEPIFDLATSEKYKEKITELVNQQKALIKSKKACICQTDWVVGNSRKQGEIMTRRYINLTLRAFNGECDSLISKVRWNNVNRFEQRITKAFAAINKLGQSNNTFITDGFLKLKLEELQLTYEYAYKKQQEKEERRAIREDQREEERAQREFEKAVKEAELEEKRFQRALERAQNELGLVTGEDLEKLNAQIENLKQSLKEAQEAKIRAISRAQETKSGHVYIISNLGSFGEDIYKIGMTRRLEPMDRVKELGDASVPFTFDLHAMIFSENAPELENLIQKEFHDRRVNKVNNRKEYFRVTLDEIEQVVLDKYDKEVEFVKLSEAQQFRETQSIIKQLQKSLEEEAERELEKYPDTLF
jgi:multidrug efflux pump subunit AcrA (membrane-fusion protein)